MLEEWRNIDDTNNKYSISSFGKVKNNNSQRILKLQKNKKGYQTIRLLISKNNRKCALVHRLVCQAFIENKLNLPQVNHINGIKVDNRVNNLEWITNLNNIKHSWKIGLRKKENYLNKTNGTKNVFAKLKKTDIIFIRMNKGSISQNTLAKKYKVNQSTISRIMNTLTYTKE